MNRNFQTSIENGIIVSYLLFLYGGLLIKPFTELYNNDYFDDPLDVRCPR